MKKTAAHGRATSYLRKMWSIGCSDLNNQLDAAFDSVEELDEALTRMTALKAQQPGKHVWAGGAFYDIAAQVDDRGAVGFVLRPTVEVNHEPPARCRPYAKAELLELVSNGRELVSGHDFCSHCRTTQRGRYANRGANGHRLFLCSTCEHWSETLPQVEALGRRSRLSKLAESA